MLSYQKVWMVTLKSIRLYVMIRHGEKAPARVFMYMAAEVVLDITQHDQMRLTHGIREQVSEVLMPYYDWNATLAYDAEITCVIGARGIGPLGTHAGELQVIELRRRLHRLVQALLL